MQQSMCLRNSQVLKIMDSPLLPLADRSKWTGEIQLQVLNLTGQFGIIPCYLAAWQHISSCDRCLFQSNKWSPNGVCTIKIQIQKQWLRPQADGDKCATDLVVSSASSWSQRVWLWRTRLVDWVSHSFLWFYWDCSRSGRHWFSPAPSPAFSAWWGSWQSLQPWPVLRHSGEKNSGLVVN